MNVLGNFVAKDFKARYYTTVCTIGQVLTNMNNPLKEQGLRPSEVDSKDMPRGFISARECAKWMLLNFSTYFYFFDSNTIILISNISLGYKTKTGAHPDHES